MPVAKSIIDKQLKEISSYQVWFTKKEIDYLPNVITEGEIIKAISSGRYDGNTWLVVVTTRRLLFLDKGFLFGLKQVEMPLNKRV